jgi:hypothetical protein
MNNQDKKRMQELAGIKPNNNLSLLFQQIHLNSIKREKEINNLMKSIVKEHKDVNNRKS